MLYDVLHSTGVVLMSRFILPEFVRDFQKEKSPKQKILEIVENPDNYFDVEDLFRPVMCKQQLRRLFEEGDISLVQKRKLLKVCVEFHKAAFIYAIKNFPMFDEFLKHARVLDILDQKCSFNSVMYLVDAVKSYVSFTPAHLTHMEEEFTILQSMNVNDFPKEAANEATIRIDDNGNPEVYRIDVLWYHLFNTKMSGVQTRKFKNMFSLAKVVLSIVHSTPEEELCGSFRRAAPFVEQIPNKKKSIIKLQKKKIK